jgi:hypothetical protein
MTTVPAAGDTGPMSTAVPARTTTAFYVQAALSFGISLVALVVGIAYLPVGAWVRAFLALGLLYVVTSTFTLAKCVRDQQEASSVISRVDQVRLEKLLADYDPFKTSGVRESAWSAPPRAGLLDRPGSPPPQ